MIVYSTTGGILTQLDEKGVALQAALSERYEILREVGRGGMATVFLARDLRHPRSVALKVLRQDFALLIGAERFHREIAILAGLQHPHILGLIDSGAAGGTFYYAMPFVEGESLRHRLDRETQLSVEDAVAIAREVAGALDYAHHHGVIHRDIKPENILLSNGQAVVADFGIAKAMATAGSENLTETGLAIGTPTYMSPEQYAGAHSLDGRSDIYALGCVLYEMLAGSPPFTGSTPQAILARHSIDPVPSLRTVRATVPAGIEWAIGKAMAKVPSDRFATAADFATALAHPERAPVARPARNRRIRVALGVGALVLAAGLGLAYGTSHRGFRGSSLAVLPIENLTGDTAQVYLADGMTDQLFTDLAQIKALKVINSASVTMSQKTGQTVLQVGRTLGVNAVLTGSLRGSGDSLHLSVRLIAAEDGRALWAQRYDGMTRDMPRYQNQIAQAVVQRLGVEFRPEERAHLGVGRVIDPAAFANYIKGRYFWNKRDLAPAKDFFTKALDIDPTYAAAYAGLADTYNQIGYLGKLPPGEAFPKAKAAALRALEQDSSNAEAHVSLGYAMMYFDRDWAGAEREFRTAITLNPNWATAHDEYSLYLLAMGRFDEAEAEVQQAVRLDPLSATIAGEAGWVSHYRGRQDEAATRIRAAVALDSSDSVLHFQLGRVYQAQGKYSDAWTEYGVAGTKGFVTGIGAMGNVAGAQGNRVEARKSRVALDSVSREGKYVSPYVVALVQLGLGDKDSAFVWLDRAVKDRTHWILWLNRDPRWTPLRSDPRFKEVGRRVGLPL